MTESRRCQTNPSPPSEPLVSSLSGPLSLLTGLLPQLLGDILHILLEVSNLQTLLCHSPGCTPSVPPPEAQLLSLTWDARRPASTNLVSCPPCSPSLPLRFPVSRIHPPVFSKSGHWQANLMIITMFVYLLYDFLHIVFFFTDLIFN